MARFHHTGVAVPSITDALPLYIDVLGMRQVTEVMHDPVQKVKVVLLAYEGQEDGPFVELVEPSGQPSPVDTVLRTKNYLYHYCVEVQGPLEDLLAELRQHRVMVVQRPVPAVLFGGRRITWVFTPTRHLIEYLEQENNE